MGRKTWIGAAALILIGACAAWYFLSPAYAMSQLREAAVQGDADELEDRIDFPKVRESMKADLRANLVAEMAKQSDNGFAALGGMLAMNLVDGMIDGVVTPQGMAAMIEHGRFQKQGAPQAEQQQPEWKVEHDGIDRFIARAVGPDGAKGPGLVFHRDGLGWRLVRIDIPAEAFGGS